MSTIILAAIVAILPPQENAIVREVAARYRLNEEQTALLCAIRKAENGAPHLAFGVNDRRARIDFRTQCAWAAGTIAKRYRGDVRAFAQRWCPHNWRVWERNVRWFMSKQGVAK